MTTGVPGTGSTGPTMTTGAADQPTGTVGAAVDQAKEKAGELVEQAKGQATPRLEGQKERAAAELGSTARALRQTSQQLRAQEEGPVAQYTERAADRVEQAAQYLRERDVNELVGELERVARRQPVLFVGGAFALGLFAGRLLKSSGQRGRDAQSSTPRGYLPAPGQTSGSPYAATPTTDVRTGAISRPPMMGTDAAGTHAGMAGTPGGQEVSPSGPTASPPTAAGMAGTPDAGLGTEPPVGTGVGGAGVSPARPEMGTGYTPGAERR